MMDYPQPTSYTCWRCGRIVGPQILRCPDLRSGDCAFRKVRCVSVLGSLLGFARDAITCLVATSGFVAAAIAIRSPLFVFGVGSVVALFIGTVLSMRLRTYTLLQDPTSGLAWTRVTALGLTLRCHLIARGEPLPKPLCSHPPPRLPPSVVALSHPDSNTAVSIVRAALLGLWARSYIRIWRYHRYVAHGWARYEPPQGVYTFSLDPESNWASADGDLEREMLLVLSHRTDEEGEPGIGPFGPSAYSLVRSLGERERASLQQRIVGCATRDAVDHGWGQFQGWLHKRYGPSPRYSALLYQEQISLNALSSWLAREQPDFAEALDAEIASAVRSPRDAPQEYDYVS
jgi:hypothetical protein